MPVTNFDNLFHQSIEQLANATRRTHYLELFEQRVLRFSNFA